MFYRLLFVLLSVFFWLFHCLSILILLITTLDIFKLFLGTINFEKTCLLKNVSAEALTTELMYLIQLGLCICPSSETHGWLRFVPRSSLLTPEWGTKRNQPWGSDDAICHPIHSVFLFQIILLRFFNFLALIMVVVCMHDTSTFRIFLLLLDPAAIRPFTCSPLLICRGVCDLRKDHYGSHASEPLKMAIARLKCFSYYIGNCWVCTDTVWVGLKFTWKLCFRVNFVLPMLYLYIPNHFQYSKSHVAWSFDFPLLKVWWWIKCLDSSYVICADIITLLTKESRMTMVH